MAVAAAPGPRSWLRRLLSVVVAGAGLVLVVPQTPAQSYPLNRCAPTENGLPVLERVSVTQRVDVRRTARRVRIAVRAHDTGGPGVRTGLRAVRVQVGGYGYADLEYAGRRWWVGYLRIPRWSRGGPASLTSVQLTDRADFPYRGYDDEYLFPQPDVTYFRGGEHRWSQVAGDRTFRVRSLRDVRAPRLAALDFRPRRVDTRQRRAVVTVTARGTDDRSQISRIRATFHRPDVDYYRAPVTVSLRRVPGHPRRFTGRMTIPRNAGTGDWSLLSVLVIDRARNSISLGAPEIAKRGWPRVLRVVSAPEPARAAPTIVSVTADRTTADVREADQSVTYRLHAVNPVAPLPPDNETVGMSLAQPERSWVRLSTARLVSGDLHEGVWEIVATVDSCVALPGTLTPSVSPEGGATAPPVQVLAGDNTTPVLTAHRSGATLVVDFSEDVNGISTDSLTVLRRDGLDYAAVPGSWSCGTGVDCVAGPVRTATFTPTGTGAVLIRANPDGRLDITDRAGNPAHQSLQPVAPQP